MLDETVDVYLVLGATNHDATALRSHLSRLAISIEARVVNDYGPERNGGPAAEVIFNGIVEDTAKPLVLLDEPGDSDDEEGHPRLAYAVWKVPVLLSRPRMRLQNPTVSFAAIATLRSAVDTAETQKNGYLESRTPLGLNLLEAFGADPALGGVKPRLSAQRVSRVAPVTQTREQHRPIKGLKFLVLKVFPAVHTRLRFVRPSAVPASPGIIALLEVDFTPFVEGEAVLSRIDLAVPSAVVTDLNEDRGPSLPLSCVAHDHITFMYKLAPLEHDLDALRHPTRDVDITMEATVLVQPGVCVPKLTMSGVATLDFTLPVNPGFGTALTNPSIQRAHRPSQLSIDGAASLVAPAVSRPDSLPSLEAATRKTETTIPDFGITMTFTAPPGPVYAGDEFCWTVFVVNRSSAAVQGAGAAAASPPPRKLALVAIPRRRRSDVRAVRPHSTTNPFVGAKTAGADQDGEDRRRLVADAVLDENIVHAMQRSSLVDAADVVCLNADARVGPLAPNSCHTVDLRFVALREGIVGVEAVRVIDLATQEHVDVRELPVMLVERRQ